jgi:hypothetical protein
MGDGDSNDWDPTQIYDTVSNLVPVAGTVLKDAKAILQFIGYWTDPDPLSEAYPQPRSWLPRSYAHDS